MNPNSIPPLLRGLGLTIVLAGTLVGLIQAHHEVTGSPLKPSPAATLNTKETELSALSAEIHGLRGELQHESVAEEVLENRWFEWLGILGSGVVAFSFYAEWFIRKDKVT